MQQPLVSLVIPTLNAAKVLTTCLESIAKQNYPKTKIEIIVADGGSTDGTLEVAKSYGARIYPNPLKTGEAGKAVGISQAKGDLIALIDSDNILPSSDWLQQMTIPFADLEIQLSEPLTYTWRPEGGIIERYSALLGMNDPLCLFMGNYDRYSYLTGKWTEIPHQEVDKGEYLKVRLTSLGIPTIGANGTMYRKTFIEQVNIGDYLFDIDLVSQYIQQHKSLEIAKVKNGIIHTYCEGSISKFTRKQKRRINDYLYYNKLGIRNYAWAKHSSGIYKFIIYCLTVVPLFYQAVRGYIRKPDPVWFLHPLLCWITLVVYGTQVTMFKLGFKAIDVKRNNWKQ